MSARDMLDAILDDIATAPALVLAAPPPTPSNGPPRPAEAPADWTADSADHLAAIATGRTP